MCQLHVSILKQKLKEFPINFTQEYYSCNLRNALGLQERRYVIRPHVPGLTPTLFNHSANAQFLLLAYQANPWSGKILSKNNIPVAYKSDHPVFTRLYGPAANACL